MRLYNPLLAKHLGRLNCPQGTPRQSGLDPTVIGNNFDGIAHRHADDNCAFVAGGLDAPIDQRRRNERPSSIVNYDNISIGANLFQSFFDRLLPSRSAAL